MAEQESVAVFGQGGGETEVSCVILQSGVGLRAGQLGPGARRATSTKATSSCTTQPQFEPVHRLVDTVETETGEEREETLFKM
jgi:hypothetical protein